jgi:hypothetical protein
MAFQGFFGRRHTHLISLIGLVHYIRSSFSLFVAFYDSCKMVLVTRMEDRRVMAWHGIGSLGHLVASSFSSTSMQATLSFMSCSSHHQNPTPVTYTPNILSAPFALPLHPKWTPRRLHPPPQSQNPAQRTLKSFSTSTPKPKTMFVILVQTTHWRHTWCPQCGHVSAGKPSGTTYPDRTWSKRSTRGTRTWAQRPWWWWRMVRK